MSWITEASAVYDMLESSAGENLDGNKPLPLYHSTQNAQIEVTVFSDGTFSHASLVDPDDSVTRIPVTEKSASRGSGVAPHPLCDKLIYVAGDYCQYAKSLPQNADDCFPAYINALEKWVESDYSDSIITSVFKYLSKKVLIKDLIKSDILTLKNGKLDTSRKFKDIEQSKAFVRFIVNDPQTNKRTEVWKCERLVTKFIDYYNTFPCDSQLCYATGEIVPITYLHMAKLRNSKDKAKLISSNDESNFTFRGRFKTREEAYALGRLTSQKAHLALRWLSENGATQVGDAKYLAWESNLNTIPNVFENSKYDFNDEDMNFEKDEDDNSYAKTVTEYQKIIGKAIKGYKQDLDFDSKVILMSVDSATTGRLSITMYQELKSTVYYDNLQKWYSQTLWHGCYFTKSKKRVDCVQTPVPYEIARCAYGVERIKDNNKEIKFEIEPKLFADVLKQIYPCITLGAKLPDNILKAIFNKASNPQCYSNKYNWEKVVDVCCALHRNYYIEKRGVEYNMKLDRGCKDRSYLYGRLIAVADKIEWDTYKQDTQKANNDNSVDGENDNPRMTNAMRLMSNVIKSPSATWGYIHERLGPYLDKILNQNVKFYVAYINEIKSIHVLFKPGEYEMKKPLDPLFFMGFYGEMDDLYTSKKDKNDNKKEEQ